MTWCWKTKNKYNVQFLSFSLISNCCTVPFLLFMTSVTRDYPSNIYLLECTKFTALRNSTLGLNMVIVKTSRYCSLIYTVPIYVTLFKIVEMARVANIWKGWPKIKILKKNFHMKTCLIKNQRTEIWIYN